MATSTSVRNFQPSARILSRSNGDSAAGKAAYNARTRIENERDGRVYDWTKHPNHVISEHFFAAANAPEFAKTREGYWQGVEARENRTDSQLALDWVIPLPHELEANPEHALMPLRDFIRENFQRKGYGADLAFHPAHDHGDERNFHAHLMVGIRRFEKDGSWARVKDGVPDPEQLSRLRERMTAKLNKFLEQNGYEIQLDQRSYAERGIDKEATVHLGKAAAALERRGIETEVGNMNRATEARNLAREAELAELERLYALEQKSAAERPVTALAKVAPTVALAIIPKLGPALEPPQPLHVGTVERLREDDRQHEELRQRHRDPAARSIIAAMWALTKTMGNTIAHIVLGADRVSLVRGRQLDLSGMRPKPARLEPEAAPAEAAQSPAAPAKQTGPNPYARMRGILEAIEERGAIVVPIDNRKTAQQIHQDIGSNPARKTALEEALERQRDHARRIALGLERPGKDVSREIDGHER